MRYLVTYEIPGRHPEYPPLIAVLRSLRAQRMLPTTWIVESELAAFDLSRHVMAAGCLSQTDRLLIVSLAPDVDAAWKNVAVADAHVPFVLGRTTPTSPG